MATLSAPGEPVDLAVGEVTSSTVELTWTNPAVDEDVHNAKWMVPVREHHVKWTTADGETHEVRETRRL